jgi:hypothetical protein
MVRLCAQMAYAGARATYRDVYEWTPAPRAVMRMVDAVGEQAREFLEQAPAPEDDGEVLVIQVDGKGAPMINSAEHERRCQPKRRRGALSARLERRARRIYTQFRLADAGVGSGPRTAQLAGRSASGCRPRRR